MTGPKGHSEPVLCDDASGIHLSLASSSCFTLYVVPNSLYLLSLTYSLNKHLQLFAKFLEPQGLGL